MTTLNYLGFEKQEVQSVTAGLHKLLANFQIYYTNLRGFHWNVQGKGFFILHRKFEELYTQVAEQVDEVAERLLQLDEHPTNNFSKYLEVANIKEVSDVTCGKVAAQTILDNLKVIIDQEREIIKVAAEIGDDVTVALLGEYLKFQEKQVWMLLAFLQD